MAKVIQVTITQIPGMKSTGKITLKLSKKKAGHATIVGRSCIA
jgi:hypothetical protein